MPLRPTSLQLVLQAALPLVLPSALLLAPAVPARGAPAAEPVPAAAAMSAPAPAAASLPGQDQIIDTATAVLDVSRLAALDEVIDQLGQRRVVFVGETHDRYEDHLNQLAIIQGLVRRGKDVAIGVEFFQQPYQVHLDAYIAGAIGEAELLRRTEYFDRWRFDYRLYRPILRYARAEGLPIIALNLPGEVIEKVGDNGIDALGSSEAAWVPAEIDRSDAAYRDHIKAIFDLHPSGGPNGAEANFEHFLEAQLLWDEGMAERAARYLERHPEKTLVVLAGSGHIEYGRGIPGRLLRRMPVASATLLNGAQRRLDPALADFLLFPQEVGLPATGLLGVMLDTESAGAGIGVQGFADDSGAKAAGVKTGDRIVRVGGQAIDSYADIRIALMDSRPGQRLPVEVLRAPLLGTPERLTFEVELH